jgi:hypothetical protein
LLNRGDRVIGIDHFDDYYDPLLKRKNIAHLAQHPSSNWLKLRCSSWTGLHF